MSDLFQAPDVSDRLLFGLVPPPGVADQIVTTARRLCGTLGMTNHVVAQGHVRLSLQGLGDHAGLRRDIVKMAAEAAAAAPRPGAIDLRFDRAETRFSARGGMDLVLRSSEPLPALVAFQAALGRAMASSGLGRLVDRRFEPEIVMIGDVRAFGEARIEPIAWTATSMALLHVLLGRAQAVPLARFSLLPDDVAADASAQARSENRS